MREKGRRETSYKVKEMIYKSQGWMATLESEYASILPWSR